MARIAASDLFATFGDLPLHPLVVHFAVVILPLSALGLIAIIFIPKWRRSLGWLVVAGLAVGAGASFVAKESGESLAQYVGLPQQHADYGTYLVPVSVLLFLCAVAWFYLSRKNSGRSLLSTILAVVSIVLAIAATVLTILVGHTGAQAAWGAKFAAVSGATSQQSSSTNQQAGQAASSQATQQGTQTAGAASATYTMADVQQHSSATDCWTVVNGDVYDVTAWIDQHPGGSKVILKMCGVDGSNSFNLMHGTQPRPANELANFFLGPLQ